MKENKKNDWKNIGTNQYIDRDQFFKNYEILLLKLGDAGVKKLIRNGKLILHTDTSESLFQKTAPKVINERVLEIYKKNIKRFGYVFKVLNSLQSNMDSNKPTKKFNLPKCGEFASILIAFFTLTLLGYKSGAFLIKIEQLLREDPTFVQMAGSTVSTTMRDPASAPKDEFKNSASKKKMSKKSKKAKKNEERKKREDNKNKKENGEDKKKEEDQQEEKAKKDKPDVDDDEYVFRTIEKSLYLLATNLWEEFVKDNTDISDIPQYENWKIILLIDPHGEDPSTKYEYLPSLEYEHVMNNLPDWCSDCNVPSFFCFMMEMMAMTHKGKHKTKAIEQKKMKSICY